MIAKSKEKIPTPSTAIPSNPDYFLTTSGLACLSEDNFFQKPNTQSIILTTVLSMKVISCTPLLSVLIYITNLNHFTIIGIGLLSEPGDLIIKLHMIIVIAIRQLKQQLLKRIQPKIIFLDFIQKEKYISLSTKIMTLSLSELKG